MAPLTGKKYIVIVVILIVIAVGATALTIYFPSKYPAGTAVQKAQPTITPTPVPTPPPQPAISVSVEKNGTKRSVIIRWVNLPDGTTALDVFISKTNANKWSLWKTIAITPAELGGGSADFSASAAIAGGGYSFYAAAENGGGSAPLWTSSSTVPVQTTSTTQTGGSPAPTVTPTPTPSSSPTPTPTPTPSGTSNSTSTQNSTGTVYYTPSGSVSGESQPQTANFWVEHVNNDLQINWQNIPSDANEAIVYRSASGSGPWTKILDQSNPAVSYSIGIVDNSLNGTYYYKLDVLKSGSIEAEYGPVELAPL